MWTREPKCMQCHLGDDSKTLRWQLKYEWNTFYSVDSGSAHAWWDSSSTRDRSRSLEARVSLSTREQLARSGSQVDTPAISQLQLVAITHRVGQTALLAADSVAPSSDYSSGWNECVKPPAGLSPCTQRCLPQHGQDRGVIPRPFGWLWVNSPYWVRHLRRCVQGEWEHCFPGDLVPDKQKLVSLYANTDCRRFHFLSSRWCLC